MRTAETCRAFAFISLLIFICQPIHAATIFGTVTGPDGPVSDARVIANDWNGADFETTSDASGEYSLELPSGGYNFIWADSKLPDSGLVGEYVWHITLEDIMELRLFLAREIELSGVIQLPADFTGSVSVLPIRLDKPQNWFPAEFFSNDLTFKTTVPAGIYSLLVSPACNESTPSDVPNHLGQCGSANYLGHVNVNATQGSQTNIVIPAASYRAPVMNTDPPIAELIHVGPSDARGIAIVTGLPGAAQDNALIQIANLQTQLVSEAASNDDGSFSIPMFAPSGSFLSIAQDSKGINSGFAPSTIIQAPLDGDPKVVFSAIATEQEGTVQLPGQHNSVATIGLISRPEIQFTGELAGRAWQGGDSIGLEGDFRVYFRDSDKVDPPVEDETLHGNIVLEQIFDASGKQVNMVPSFASAFLTPTGLPMEDGNVPYSRSIIWAASIDYGDLITPDAHGFNGTWSASIVVPENLPDGTYQLTFRAQAELEPVDIHFEDVFEKHSNRVANLPGIAAIVTIGSPQPGRLSWALGLNEFSDGTRGIVAQEDAGKFQIAGQVASNGQAFIFQKTDPLRRIEKFYRLEPDQPLMGVANDGFLFPPRIPLKFPSGELGVVVEHPDGSKTDLGTAPFRQPFFQAPAQLNGDRPHSSSNIVRLYSGLTTLDDRFKFQFDQFGKHMVVMTGTIEDIYGNHYEGGGNYEVNVARQLDLETGVFTNTPFEVGDTF
jgi:hypothetical protein